jgi:hypothetical protein
MVALGISDINTKDLFNFRFQNTTSPESGWYEFSTSNSLIIKPRDFSISIISDEYIRRRRAKGMSGRGSRRWILAISSPPAAKPPPMKS